MRGAALQRQSNAASPECEVCGCAIRIKPTGRPRRYCSNKCRQKSVRNRRILLDVLTEIEAIRLGVALIDWSDEDHRVA